MEIFKKEKILSNEYMADFLLLLYILKMADDYCGKGGKADFSCINWNTGKIHNEIIAEYRDDIIKYLNRCEQAEHFHPNTINSTIDIPHTIDMIKSLGKNDKQL